MKISSKLVLSLLSLAVALCGCHGFIAADGTLSKPHTTLINQKVTAGKIGQNLLTGQYELIAGHVETTFIFVPVYANTNAAGQVTGVVLPDVTWESALYGRSGIFGAAGGEQRFSTGANGVNTQLGGGPTVQAPSVAPGYNSPPGSYSATNQLYVAPTPVPAK